MVMSLSESVRDEQAKAVASDVIVIMPVYDDSESAAILLENIAAIFPAPPYIVIVEDGSVSKPASALLLSQAGLSGEVLYLARNMGHQRAIAVGVTYVASHYDVKAVIIMDSDGEDRPDSIAPLLDELANGKCDVVVAERRKRSEAFSFRMFYSIYRQFFKLMTGREIRFGNFTALSMRAAKRLAAMPELWLHVAASIMVSKLRVANVATDRGHRYAGKSQMNFVSLSLHGLRSIMVFAEDVLVRVGIFCALLASCAIILLAASVILKIVGHATPGWFSIAFGTLLLIVMQAGILTFVTLMITGLQRNRPPITKAELAQLIDRIEVA